MLLFLMIWLSSAIGAAVGCFLISHSYYSYYLKQKKDLQLHRERGRAIGDEPRNSGKFELIDSKGEIVKSDDFLGQWVMLYFGVTHCPDICPGEVEKMIVGVDEYEKKQNVKVQPIFISVDPDRDTPKVMEKYCKKFSDKIIGLTGTHEQVAKACKAYRVNYSNGPKDTDNGHNVGHTSMMYLVDPWGFYIDCYKYMVKLAVLKYARSSRPSFSFKTSGSPAQLSVSFI